MTDTDISIKAAAFFALSTYSGGIGELSPIDSLSLIEEYELIMLKKSRLSASKRRMIVRRVERQYGIGNRK